MLNISKFHKFQIVQKLLNIFPIEIYEVVHFVYSEHIYTHRESSKARIWEIVYEVWFLQPWQKSEHTTFDLFLSKYFKVCFFIILSIRSVYLK